MEIDDCRPVYQRKCEVKFEEKCWIIPSQKCEPKFSKECETFKNQLCSEVPVQKCRTVQDRKCSNFKVTFQKWVFTFFSHFTLQRKNCSKGKELKCEDEYVKSCEDRKDGYKGFTRRCEGIPIRKCHEVFQYLLKICADIRYQKMLTWICPFLHFFFKDKLKTTAFSVAPLPNFVSPILPNLRV